MRFKRLVGSALAPTKAHEDDAGFDVYAPSSTTIKPGQVAKIGLGIAIMIEKGTVAIMSERSGMAVNSQITSIGNIIDAGYRGEISIILANLSDKQFRINAGDRIGQIVICQLASQELAEVDELEETSRGVSGYGSSGR